ncbi:MAG: DUF4251 domain-containing protein [Flavobacteriaceae bacterium]|nr:DUF4251 domain-containing protein [Flavobacteriaceae bacterium]
MKKNVLALVALVTLGTMLSCGSQKSMPSAEELAALKQQIDNKELDLRARWANPLGTRSINAIASAGLLPPGSSANRIEITGTASFLRIQNDSVFAKLPYYGERQFASTYNPQDVGINFEGVPKDLSIDFNEKKQAYDFQFDIVNELGEGFNVNGTVYPNNAATFYVNSTQRLTIGYSGFLNKVSE